LPTQGNRRNLKETNSRFIDPTSVYRRVGTSVGSKQIRADPSGYLQNVSMDALMQIAAHRQRAERFSKF